MIDRDDDRRALRREEHPRLPGHPRRPRRHPSGRGAAPRRFLLPGRLLAPFALLSVALLGAACGRDKGLRPSGTLEATETDLAPTITGRALEVRAALGEQVARGDTLIVLDTELLALQRAQAAATRRSIQAQKEAAREDLRQAGEKLELAGTTLERLESLAARGTATRQAVDEASTQKNLAQSRVAGARSHQSVLDADEAKLEAALAVYDRHLADGVLISPLDGTVLVRALEPGEMASPGRTALRVADLSRLELRIFLSEEDLDLIRLGDRIPVYVDALEGKALPGRVTWISSEAEFTPKNAQTREARAQLVYAAKVELENPDGLLKIGMPAEADVAAAGAGSDAAASADTGAEAGTAENAGAGAAAGSRKTGQR